MTKLGDLTRAARRLNRAAGAPDLPALFFLTDPQRTPHPCGVSARLPPGAAVIYRHFGAPDRLAVARRLRVATRRRGLVLLIGADAPLAARIAADGVHLPERMAGTAVALKRTYPGWLITAAAHSARALHAARPADAALLSPVFPSQSRSAGAALGPARAAALARRAPLPVIALGGVTAATARRLRGGFAGLAAIDGVLESLEAER